MVWVSGKKVRVKGREMVEIRVVDNGTGMGLAICKKIAERHGGRISVRREPGRGATFTGQLPCQPTGP